MDQLVGQQFRSVRSERDRCLRPGLAKDRVRVLGARQMVVLDGRESGVEHAGRAVEFDGHHGSSVRASEAIVTGTAAGRLA